jgi:hypothetical protein
MWNKIFNFVSGASTLWGFLPVAVTTSITATIWLVVMAVVGYLQGIPIFWIMMGLPVAGAAIFTWILRFSEWRERNTAAGKLSFQGILLGQDFTRDPNGTPIDMLNAQIRLTLISSASFPVSFIVEELQTSLEGKFPPHKPREDKGGMVLRGDLKTYGDNPIEMKNAPLVPKVIGTAQFKIKYGHPGREKYPIERKMQFEAVYEPSIKAYLVQGHRDVA